MRISLSIKAQLHGLSCDLCRSDIIQVTIRRGHDSRSLELCQCNRPWELVFEDRKEHTARATRANVRRANKHARSTAADTGALAQRASGGLQHTAYKGDVRHSGKFRVECKFTSSKEFTLTREVLDKIRAECTYPETPAVDILFADKAGKEVDRWVVIPYEEWLEKHASDNN